MHPTAYNLVKIGKNFNRIIKITNGKKAKQSFEKKYRYLIVEALKNNVFSACSVGFFEKNKNVVEGDIFNYGFVGEDQMKISIDEDTFFDLASLTKPLVTSLCLLALLEEGKIKIDDKLDKFFD